ncbi:hypothetical protein ACOTEH_04205 [Achromobacter xylosoxidans]
MSADQKINEYQALQARIGRVVAAEHRVEALVCPVEYAVAEIMPDSMPGIRVAQVPRPAAGSRYLEVC